MDNKLILRTPAKRLLLVSWLLLLPCMANAVDFFSTGVDDAGNLLAAGEVDPHYSLLHAATGSPLATAYATVDNPGSWLAAGSDYQWINPTGRGNDNLPCRACAAAPPSAAFPDYFYSTTFDLSGVDLATVYIEFQIAADNAANININGNYIGRYAGFAALQTIVLEDASWFLDGMNRLEFGVANTGVTDNPTGLMIRVVAARTPEPFTLALFSIGLLGIGLLRLRARGLLSAAPSSRKGRRRTD